MNPTIAEVVKQKNDFSFILHFHLKRKPYHSKKKFSDIQVQLIYRNSLGMQPVI
jgi:hypothetical protein